MTKIKVHRVLEGPVSSEDMGYDFTAYGILAYIETDKDDGCEELWFETLEEAYEIKKHTETKIEPYILEDMVDLRGQTQ